MTNEVNENKNFATLRQVYNSLILATWYKKKIKDSILAQVYADKNKIAGVRYDRSVILSAGSLRHHKYSSARQGGAQNDTELIYHRYLQAFKKGVFNYIKEEPSLVNSSGLEKGLKETIPRKYFSGGFGFDRINTDVTVSEDAAMLEGASDRAADELVLAIGVRDAAQLSQQKMIDHILIPFWGGSIPKDVELTQETSPDGVPILSIKHTAIDPTTKREIPFEYEIQFKGDEIELPARVHLGQKVVLSVPVIPDDNWDVGQKEDLRYAIKRIMIADPYHYRYSGRIVPEPYQERAIAANLEEFKTQNHAINIMATATGKTLVAFQTMDRYLDSLPQDQRDDENAVLFIVNNNTILSEAQDKLREMFGDKYRPGQIYGGAANYEKANVIFATFSSLENPRTIQGLLTKKKIKMVIADEVHHLPAETMKGVYQIVQEYGLRKNWNTKYLGLTATEVRPDELSVLRFFGNRVTFEYRMSEGISEGNLVPIYYLNADQDINPNGQIIVPGTPAAQQFNEIKYANDRFPHIFSKYMEVSETHIDRRALFLAPDTERSQALAAYFRQRGVVAVSLTSEDRDLNPLKFEHSYKAWKNGQWPEGSPFAGEPVPQVVMAVNIFKEGIDVPAINAVFLWRDTNSLIDYVQGIGRGLRMRSFKTHLTVVDLMGLYRKANLMQYLSNVMRDIYTKTKKRGGKRGGPSGELPKAIPDDSFAPQNVTADFNRFISDLPGALLQRYGSYVNIPVDELHNLDIWIVRTFNILLETNISETSQQRALDEFYAYMRQLGDRLKENSLSEEEIGAIRERFLPVLLFLEEYSADRIKKGTWDINSREIIRGPALDAVLNRLFFIINFDREDDKVVTVSDFRKIFKEFLPSKTNVIRNRAANLQFMRRKVFRMSDEAFGLRMYATFKSIGHLRDFTQAEEAVGHYHSLFLNALVHSFDGGQVRTQQVSDFKYELEIAEGRLKDTKLDRDYRAQDVSAEPQDSFIFGILADEKVKGHGLRIEDFELPPEEFRELIRKSGLLVSVGGVEAVMAEIRRLFGAFGKGLEEENPDAIAAIQNQLLGHLQALSTMNVDAQSVSHADKKMFRRILDFYHSDKSKFLSDNETGERIRALIDGLAERLEIGMTIETDLVVRAKAQLWDTLKNPEAVDLDFMVKINEEKESKKVGIFRVRKDASGHNVFVFQLDSLQVQSLKLTDEEMQQLILATLKRLYEEYDNQALFVLDSFGDTTSYKILETLKKLIIETTDLPVLGVIRNLGIWGGRSRWDLSLHQLMGSRVPTLTSEELIAIRARLDQRALISAQRKERGEAGFSWHLADIMDYIYRAYYDFSTQVYDSWKLVKPALQDMRTHEQRKDYQHMMDVILELIDQQVNKDVTGDYRMKILKNTLLALRKGMSHDGQISDYAIQFAFVYAHLGIKFVRFDDRSEYKEKIFLLRLLESYFRVLPLSSHLKDGELVEYQKELQAIIEGVSIPLIQDHLPIEWNKRITDLNNKIFLRIEEINKLFKIEKAVARIQSTSQTDESIRKEIEEMFEGYNVETVPASQFDPKKIQPPFFVQIFPVKGDPSVSMRVLGVWIVEHNPESKKKKKKEPIYAFHPEHAQKILETEFKGNGEIKLMTSRSVPRQEHKYPKDKLYPHWIFYAWDNLNEQFRKGEIPGAPLDKDGNFIKVGDQVVVRIQRKEGRAPVRTKDLIPRYETPPPANISTTLNAPDAPAPTVEAEAQKDTQVSPPKVRIEDLNPPFLITKLDDDGEKTVNVALWKVSANPDSPEFAKLSSLLKRPYITDNPMAAQIELKKYGTAGRLEIVTHWDVDPESEPLRLDSNMKQKNFQGWNDAVKRYERNKASGANGVHFVDEKGNLVDAAMVRGGIDLTAANKYLQTQNAPEGIKFHIDSAQLSSLRRAPGFVAEIINIQPMHDLKEFLAGR